MTASDPYRDETWVVSTDQAARACFVDIGEGYDGDYDETDPDDEPLYRLDVNIAARFADVYDTEGTDDPDWRYPSDGSLCTHVKIADLDTETAEALLRYAAEKVAETVAAGESIKHAMDMLSWLPARR